VIITEQLGLSEISSGALSRLIDELDEQYPDIMPDPSIGLTEVAYRAGQVSVVRQLKHKLAQLRGE
jgi:hypothetical protein